MTAQQFAPNRWVDIEPVIELKHKSIIANTFIKDWWPECEMSCHLSGDGLSSRWRLNRDSR